MNTYDSELKSLYAERPRVPGFRSMRETELQRNRIIDGCGWACSRHAGKAHAIADRYIRNIKARLGISPSDINNASYVRMPREVYASAAGQESPARTIIPNTINRLNIRERMKIYVSLPIHGRPESEAREHARRVKALIESKGHRATTPFDIYAGKNPEYPDFIGADIASMLRHDAVCFCEGWEHSVGCNIERQAMKFYNVRLLAEGKPCIRTIYENNAAYEKKSQGEA